MSKSLKTTQSKSKQIGVSNSSFTKNAKLINETKKDNAQTNTEKFLKPSTLQSQSKTTTSKSQSQKNTQIPVNKTKKPIKTTAATRSTSDSTSSGAVALRKSSALQNNVGVQSVNKKARPLHAIYNDANLNVVKKSSESLSNNKKQQSTYAKPNAVLDTFHNVTVVSPPPHRKSEKIKIEKNRINSPNERIRTTAETSKNNETARVPTANSTQNRNRSQSRTLNPEEIIVLKRESDKKRLENQIQTESNITTPIKVKQPVAFEINLAIPNKSRENSGQSALSAYEEETYSDEFDSYESDFETGSTSTTPSVTDSDDKSTKYSVTYDGIESDSNKTSQDSDDDDDDESDTQTQYPVTVIQSHMERKLDSGSYEMNSRKSNHLTMNSQLQTQFDSIDTSEQLDSGISSYGVNTQSDVAIRSLKDDRVCYGGYTEFITKPILSKRGLELMSKIQFDTLTFTIFEMKPITYETYMQTYGALNTTQCSTQTNENRMEIECQTDICDTRAMWTQYPPQFDLQTVQRLGTASLNGATAIQNCCGELLDKDLYTNSNQNDEYDIGLQKLETFKRENNNRYLQRQLKELKKPVDIEKLNKFLLRATMLISKVLNSTIKNFESLERSLKNNRESQTLGVVSDAFKQLDMQFLNALQVIRIFANSKHNLILTVHESLPDADVYREDFSNLIMVWTTYEYRKPIRLLSTWSEVCRAEICNDNPDIIVCGLRDGSIALWDLRETYTFCSKLDGYLTHFAATHSVVPTWDSNDKKLRDFGAVVDVKSFRCSPKGYGVINAVSSDYKSIQFGALCDSGILSIWTLVECAQGLYEYTSSRNSTYSSKRRRSNINATKFEFSSPWARVKLTQSAICDLREYIERNFLKVQSKFDKTKSLFEKSIYNDELLRQLSEESAAIQDQKINQQSIQGLRFSSIDTGCELIYICTTYNFILSCTKSLKMERFRKIKINESRFLFPTALRVMTNEDFLAVGLSNGSVIIINCHQQNVIYNKKTDKYNRQQQRSMSEFAKPNKSIETLDFDTETGKSCTIQNIILNERRSFDRENYVNFTENYEIRPTTAACIELINNQKKPFELRIYDQQILLCGSSLRKNLVQTLELSSDGWILFALSDCKIRVYDFYLDRELEFEVLQQSDKSSENQQQKQQKIFDVAIAKSSQTTRHLITLDAANVVKVHLLK